MKFYLPVLRFPSVSHPISFAQKYLQYYPISFKYYTLTYPKINESVIIQDFLRKQMVNFVCVYVYTRFG